MPTLHVYLNTDYPEGVVIKVLIRPLVVSNDRPEHLHFVQSSLQRCSSIFVLLSIQICNCKSVLDKDGVLICLSCTWLHHDAVIASETCVLHVQTVLLGKTTCCRVLSTFTSNLVTLPALCRYISLTSAVLLVRSPLHDNM